MIIHHPGRQYTYIDVIDARGHRFANPNIPSEAIVYLVGNGETEGNGRHDEDEVFLIPIGYVFFSVGIESFDELIGVLFTIFGFVLICSPIIAFIPGLYKGSTHYSGSSIGSSDMDSSIDSVGRKSSWLSNDDDVRKQIYAQQDEDLSILEDMIQMRSANPDVDLQEHYGWDHKIDYDQDGGDDAW